MPAGDKKWRLPAHAGGLPMWERLAIALVLAGMAAFIVVIMISSGSPPPHPGRSAGPGGNSPAPAVAGGGPSGASVLPAPAVAENQRLAAALAPVLRQGHGRLAIGVVTGQTAAVYDGDRPFLGASLVKADILAALLLQGQRASTTLSAAQRQLAENMIENNDQNAATALWNAAGGAAGLRTANRLLHLSHTTPGGTWELTSTTVNDQLRLLGDLTLPGSPLSPASRSYELALMRHGTAGPQWGVSVAAPPDALTATANGWRPDSGTTWVVNSIGVIFSTTRPVLVAALSEGQPTESAGIDQIDAALKAAVTAITAGHATAAGGAGPHPARES